MSCLSDHERVKVVQAQNESATGVHGPEEREYRVGRRRHLRRQRFLGRIVKAEQPRGLVTQRDDLLDTPGIVEAAGYGCPLETPTVAVDTDGEDMRSLVSILADGADLGPLRRRGRRGQRRRRRRDGHEAEGENRDRLEHLHYAEFPH